MGLRKTERKLKTEISRYSAMKHEADKLVTNVYVEMYDCYRFFLIHPEQYYRDLIDYIEGSIRTLNKEDDVVRAELKTVQDKIEKRLKVIRPILTFLAVIVMIFFQVGFWWMMSTERLDIDEDSAPGATMFWIMMTAILTAAIGEARDYKKR